MLSSCFVYSSLFFSTFYTRIKLYPVGADCVSTIWVVNRDRRSWFQFPLMVFVLFLSSLFLIPSMGEERTFFLKMLISLLFGLMNGFALNLFNLRISRDKNIFQWILFEILLLTDVYYVFHYKIIPVSDGVSCLVIGFCLFFIPIITARKRLIP